MQGTQIHHKIGTPAPRRIRSHYATTLTMLLTARSQPRRWSPGSPVVAPGSAPHAWLFVGRGSHLREREDGSPDPATIHSQPGGVGGGLRDAQIRDTDAWGDVSRGDEERGREGHFDGVAFFLR